MNKLKAVFGVIVLLVLIGAGGYYVTHQVATTSQSAQTKYASAYEAHALTTPFNLLSRDWTGSTWNYHYQSVGVASDALKAVQSQLSGGGYQVIQAKPDTSDTVYRDLITGDISVTAKVLQTAPGQVGVVVNVRGINQ